MKTKNLLSLILAAAISLTYLQAQNIEFTYDNSGNRISQNVIYLDVKSATEDTLTQKSNSGHPNQFSDFESISNAKGLAIYPNPTTGVIFIKNTVELQNQKIYITKVSGAQILQKMLSSEITKIDLSMHPDGVYIMKLERDGSTESWKIIKN